MENTITFKQYFPFVRMGNLSKYHTAIIVSIFISISYSRMIEIILGALMPRRILFPLTLRIVILSSMTSFHRFEAMLWLAERVINVFDQEGHLKQTIIVDEKIEKAA
jgi:hypothetical protein